MQNLSIDDINYPFPEQSDDPPWGKKVFNWAKAITNKVTGISGADDIVNGSATINNNVSSVTNISGLSFSTTTVRGATIAYTVYRTSTTISTPKAEEGEINISYDGTSWTVFRESTADTGVTITITSSGQCQYLSTNIPGTGYVGLIKYRAWALPI